MNISKILLTFVLFLSVFALVVSCGSTDGGTGEEQTENAPGETGEETTGKADAETETEPTVKETAEATEQTGTDVTEPADDLSKKFYNYVTFDIPSDLRQAAVDYMRKQSEVVWVCSETFSTSENFEDAGWGIGLTYEKGKEYHGLPYAQTYTSMYEFEQFYLDSDRGFSGESTSWFKIPGLQCISSIVVSYQQFANIYPWSYAVNPGSDSFACEILGDYLVEPGWDSIDIINANKLNKMIECYSLLDKGDLIGHFVNGGGPHVRMVVENHLEYKSDGSVNLRKCYVKTLEQTNSFDGDRNDGVNTTWFVDHKYTYEKLYNDAYVPITLKEYGTGVSGQLFIGITEEIKADDLADGAIFGSIETNSLISFAYIDVYRKGTDELVNRIVLHNVEDTDEPVISVNKQRIDLRKYSIKLFDGVESGDYTFVLTAGIAAGSAELARVDFTYNK